LYIYSLGFGVASQGILTNPLADRWKILANEVKYIRFMQSNDIDNSTLLFKPASAINWVISLDYDLDKLKTGIFRYCYSYCILATALLILFSFSMYVGFFFVNLSNTWKFIILISMFLLGFGSLFLSIMFTFVFYWCFSKDESKLKVYDAINIQEK
ncbi:MAG: hypothetical protein J7K53_05520, partial [Bacteroidales bacterium]|nr:hypothetical protein [Bacteroidales bacterium]